MKDRLFEFTGRSRALIAALVIILLGIAWRVWGAPTGTVTLSWDYPAAEVSSVTFYVYGTNNLTIPVTQWARLATVAGPTTNATVTITPGQFFFIVTASNLWGESVPSNVASLPPLSKSPVIKIGAVN